MGFIFKKSILIPQTLACTAKGIDLMVETEVSMPEKMVSVVKKIFSLAQTIVFKKIFSLAQTMVSMVKKIFSFATIVCVTHRIVTTAGTTLTATQKMVSVAHTTF